MITIDWDKLKDRKYAINLISILVAAVLCAICIAVVVKFLLGGSVDVKFNNNGATIITGTNLLGEVVNEYATTSISANVCWQNTGILISPNDTVIIKAAGSVHTAADKIIDAAKTDQQPPFDWNGIEGRIFQINDIEMDIKRSKKLIYQSKPQRIGNLVGFLHPASNDNRPSKFNPQPGGSKNSIFQVDRNRKIVNMEDETCELYLTVNDMVLTEDDSMSYVGHENVKESSKSKSHKIEMTRVRRENWPRIIKNNEWDLFFKDNIGTFLVQIQIIPSRRAR